MARKSGKAAGKGGGPGTSVQSNIKTTQAPTFGARVAGKRAKSGRSGRR